MNTDKSLSESMTTTLLSDLGFLENIGDGLIDLFANNEVIQNIPIIGTINGVCKNVKTFTMSYLLKSCLHFFISNKKCYMRKTC